MRKLLPLVLAALFCAPAFAEGPKAVNGLFPDEILSADQLKAMIDRKEKFLLFDARDKRSYDSAHIDGAVLPRGDEYYRQEELFRQGLVKSLRPDDALKAEMAKLPKDTPIVTYCNANCHAASVLALQIKGFGFTNVRSMEEGIQAWERKGYPVVRSARVS